MLVAQLLWSRSCVSCCNWMQRRNVPSIINLMLGKQCPKAHKKLRFDSIKHNSKNVLHMSEVSIWLFEWREKFLGCRYLWRLAEPQKFWNEASTGLKKKRWTLGKSEWYKQKMRKDACPIVGETAGKHSGTWRRVQMQVQNTWRDVWPRARHDSKHCLKKTFSIVDKYKQFNRMPGKQMKLPLTGGSMQVFWNTYATSLISMHLLTLEKGRAMFPE